MKKNINIFLMFLLTLVFQSTNAHAYLVKVGDSSTCAFQCAEKVTCAKGFTNHSGTACMGKTSSCSKTAESTCGKGLKWVRQGAMNLELEIAEVESGENKFVGAEAEKELNALAMPTASERK